MKNITKALQRLDSREFREFWLVVLSYGLSVSFLGLALVMFRYGLVVLGVVLGVGGVLLSSWIMKRLKFLDKPVDIWLRSRFGLPLILFLLSARAIHEEITKQSWTFGSGLSIFNTLMIFVQVLGLVLAMGLPMGLSLFYMFHGGFREFVRRAFTKSPRRQRL